ncbi:MAG: hypothetical protein FIB07_09165 [Candidatus Methanoperedens sp.]|nr:hypothetical protein [Candidatus Methanoperedens sp.]
MHENDNYPDRNLASSTPTPTNLIPNPCKFRGKTIEILGVLSNSGGMTTMEISEQTGIPVRIVGVYCRGGEKRGVFERKERWGWRVTSFGLLILSINNNNGKTKDKDMINEG